jgi:Mn-dependent DtxR family transcriptional regulator
VKNEKEVEEQYTDRMEDYLEVIYELIKQKGYATQTDISEYLNVSSPSVTKMLKRLDESKYLHSLIAEFFKIIGVDEDIANADAEGIEHHLHPQTLKKLQEFINLTKNNSELRRRRLIRQQVSKM